MCCQLLVARRVRARRPRPALDGSHRLGANHGGGEVKAGLATADQLEIDRGEQLAIELGAVLYALAEIDAEASTERIEAELRAGKAALRQEHRVLDLAGQRRAAQPLELGTEEFKVELGIVDDQAITAED